MSAYFMADEKTRIPDKNTYNVRTAQPTAKLSVTKTENNS